MLTYQLNAEIPNTLHTFYESAFSTLVRRHDAMKAQFLRKTLSGCTVAEFASIFSAFCFMSYCQWETEFSEEQAIQYLRKSSKKNGLSKDPRSLLTDYVEAICVLQEEGQEYSFVHRTFQEYFTALFLSKCPSSIGKKFIEQGMTRYFDKVIPMWFAMDRDRLESDWVRNALNEVEFHIQNKKNETEIYFEIVKSNEFSFHNGLINTISSTRTSLAFSIETLYQMYPDAFPNSFHPSIICVFSSTEAKREHRKIRKMFSDDELTTLAFDEAENKSKKPKRYEQFITIKRGYADNYIMKKVEFSHYLSGVREALPEIRSSLNRSLSNAGNFFNEIFGD